MPTPLFVLGKHRSGTTWLANQLYQHPLIAGVAHERHEGIHESAYFSSVYNRYGDLTERNNFMEFVEVISACDYFKLAGATKDFLYSLWPTTYEDVFRVVMDTYANSQGATYWVEKSPAHTLLVDQLAATYPDAKFISITRNIEATIASTLALKISHYGSGMSRRHLITATILRCIFYNKTLQSFSARSDRMLTVQYETLRNDRASSLQKICTFLDLPFDSRMCDQVFVPNTSFGKVKRSQVLSNSERKLIGRLHRLLQLIPLNVLTLIYRAKKQKRQSLPWWFFKLHSFNENAVVSAEPSSHQELL